MKDVHLHLSGATNPVVLFELIKESGYKFRANDFWDFERQVLLDRNNVSDLNSYLDILHTIDRAQSSPTAIKRSVYNAFVSSYLAGCRYLELRWNPIKRSQGGSIDLDALIVAARAGMEKARVNFGIDGGLILCMGRDISAEANKAIFRKALQYNGKGVIGVDIAGPYMIPPPEMDTRSKSEFIAQAHMAHGFPDFYMEANDEGLITTVHAGEEPHHAVREELTFVMEVLRPRRIGHGIQIYKFPDLMEAARGFHFELCLSSNLATRAVKSEEEYAQILGSFLEHGLDYSVNTDATFLLRTDIRKENSLHQKILGSDAFGLNPTLDEAY